MISKEKMQEIKDLFGPTLPERNLFFATRQTQTIITPAYLRNSYRETSIHKAWAKFLVDYQEFVGTSVVKSQPAAAPKKPVPPVKPTTTVKKDA